MSEPTLEKEVTKLEKYLRKQGRKDFIDEMRAASDGTLESKLLSLAKHDQEIRNTMAKDEELIKAKERKADLEATYKEQLRMNAKLARFVALVMQDIQSNI